MRRIAGRWKTLVITDITLNDEGTYCLEVNHQIYELVKLSVQCMLHVSVQLTYFEKNDMSLLLGQPTIKNIYNEEDSKRYQYCL